MNVFFRICSICAGVVLWGMASAGCASPEKSAASPAEQVSCPADDVFGRAAFIGGVMDFVSKHYVDPQKADTEKLMTGALRGMLQELDPYSTYIPPRSMAVRQTQLTGEGVGVGITVSKVPHQELLVVGVVPGSPAALAGIRPGDEVLEVNNRRMRDLDLADFLDLVQGKPGTEILLTVRSAGTTVPVLHRLSRKAFVINPVPPAAVRRFPGGIGYIRIDRFNLHTVRGMLAAVRRLQNAGRLRGLILDLRNNPGGMVDAAVDMVSHFLKPSVTVFSAVGRDTVNARNVQTLDGRQTLTGMPLAVLVNEFSASASEITAGALKDHKRAVIIGGKTFGKGVIQEVRTLPNGGAIRYTKAFYRTPGGSKIDGVGVTPDVIVAVTRQDTLLLARSWQQKAAEKTVSVPDKILETAMQYMQEKLQNEP